MKTIWKQFKGDFGTLDRDIKCDTVIVGGGLAGMWCAYKLSKAGQKVCVLEASKLGSGVTKGSSAILTFGQDIIFDTLIKKHGKAVAGKYLVDTKDAIDNIKSLVEKEKFKIDFTDIDYYLFATSRGGAKKLKQEAAAYEELGERFGDATNDIDLPYKVKKAITMKSHQFDTLMLLSELTNFVVRKGGLVYENTMVTTQPTDNTLVVNGHIVRANNFIIATHFPILNFPGFYFLKMFQDQSFSIVFKPSKEYRSFTMGKTYENIEDKGFEYRRVGNNVLCCGANYRTGAKSYKSKYKILEKHINKYFEGSKEITRFSAQDCITSDLLPYAGLYSDFINNVYVLTGFNKWGMANSYITSEVVTNLILGKASNSENIYAPDRNNFFSTILETAENLGVDIANWSNLILNFDQKKFSRIKPAKGAIVTKKGKRLGVYRDTKNKLHVINAVCPHLGCGLKWNKDECSWDCPCHGSRFDVDGNILNNPTLKKAEKIISD